MGGLQKTAAKTGCIEQIDAILNIHEDLSINWGYVDSGGPHSCLVIENLLSWRHSGFNVYCGPAI